ncbi:hypothetical protein ACWEN6_20495 [Sphaerisporangium sp. NPDC004334]
MIPDSATPFSNVSFDGTPHLVLGRRSGKRDMEAVTIDLHEDVHEPLWEVCVNALGRITNGRARPYEPNAHLEPTEEYFLLDFDDIPEQPDIPSPSRKAKEAASEDENPDRTAALLRSLRDVAVLESYNPQRLPEFTPVLYYSISWQQRDESWAHFIRKANPRQMFKPGRRWFGYGDTLKRIADPAMMIDDSVDMVLTSKHLAAFNGKHLKDLFTDVHIVMQNVPKYVNRVTEILDEDSIGITPRAKDALLAMATKRYSFAVRLYQLQERLLEIKLNLEKLSTVLDQHAIDMDNVINDDGQLDFGEKQVETFLDLVDGRFFKDDFTGEARRADRFSKRILSTP